MNRACFELEGNSYTYLTSRETHTLQAKPHLRHFPFPLFSNQSDPVSLTLYAPLLPSVKLKNSILGEYTISSIQDWCWQSMGWREVAAGNMKMGCSHTNSTGFPHADRAQMPSRVWGFGSLCCERFATTQSGKSSDLSPVREPSACKRHWATTIAVLSFLLPKLRSTLCPCLPYLL